MSYVHTHTHTHTHTRKCKFFKTINWVFVSVILVALLWSCQKDDETSVASKALRPQSSTSKSVSASEIPKVMQFLESKSNSRLEFVIDDSNSELGMHRNHEENLSITTALTDQIKMVTNSYGKSNYTFKLIEEQTKEGTYFLNLVVKEYNDELYMYIIKYVPDVSWLKNFKDESAFNNFTGSVYFYSALGLYIGKVDMLNGASISGFAKHPCDGNNTSGNGGNNSGAGSTNDSGSTGDTGSNNSGSSSSSGGGGTGESVSSPCSWEIGYVEIPCPDNCDCESCHVVGIIVDCPDKSMTETLRHPCDEVPEECFDVVGDPCPHGCDAEGNCAEDSEEIEGSGVGILMDQNQVRFDFFTSTLTGAQQQFLEEHPDVEDQVFLFLVENGFSDEGEAFAEEAIESLDLEEVFTLENYPGMDDDLPFEWWNDDNFVENNFNFDVDETIGSLTQAEKMLISMYPAQALIIKANIEPAETETQSRFGENGLNNKSDAFRHAFFNAMNSNDAGDTIARLFSTAHESEVPQNLYLEKQMDLYNNNIGHTIGEDASIFVSDQELSNLVYQTLINGNLIYLFPINYTDPNFWDNPSTVKPNDGDHGITNSTQLIPTDQ